LQVIAEASVVRKRALPSNLTCLCGSPPQVVFQLSVADSQEWRELPPVRHALRTSFFLACLPAYLALRLTMPVIDPGTYSRAWLLAAMMCRCAGSDN
jgi:hypothetical protein